MSTNNEPNIPQNTPGYWKQAIDLLFSLVMMLINIFKNNKENKKPKQ